MPFQVLHCLLLLMLWRKVQLQKEWKCGTIYGVAMIQHPLLLWQRWSYVPDSCKELIIILCVCFWLNAFNLFMFCLPYYILLIKHLVIFFRYAYSLSVLLFALAWCVHVAFISWYISACFCSAGWCCSDWSCDCCSIIGGCQYNRKCNIRPNWFYHSW